MLDLFDDIPVPITKSLSDIRDLTTRSGGYSTTIEIPGTKNNMTILGHLNNLDVVNGTFDLKRKYRCVVIQGDETKFFGIIKLLGINKYDGPTGEDILTFTIQLYDELSNFYGLIRDKNLDDLFYDDIYVGYWNYNNIMATFENGLDRKYKFLLPTQTRGYYEVPDFRPSLFAYEYVDRIISTAGYKWNGSKDSNIIFQNLDNITITAPNTITVGFDWKSYGVQVGDWIQFYDFSTSITPNRDEYQILTINTAGTIITVNGTLTSYSDFLRFTIKRKSFINLNMWNLLNKSTNFEKLIIPYAGSKEVTKNPSKYNVFVGADYKKIRQSSTKIRVTWDNSSNIIQITGISNLIFGDMIRLDDSTPTDLIGYFEIQNLIGTTSGISSYNVKVVTADGILTNTIGNFSIDVYLTAWYPRKYDIFRSGVPDSQFNRIQSYFNVTDANKGYYDTFNALNNGSTSQTIYYGNDQEINLIWNKFYSDRGSDTITKNTIFNCLESGSLMISVSQFYDIIANTYVDCFVSPNDAGDPNARSFDVRFNLIVYKNNVIQNNFSLFNITNYSMPAVANYTDPGAYKLDAGINKLTTNTNFQQNTTIPVNVGDEIRVEIQCKLINNVGCIFKRKIIPGVDPVSTTDIIIIPKEGSYIKYTYTGNYQEDDYLYMKDFIPKKIKQSDFLLGLCRVFNLFIDYDDVKKELLILPKDEYYDLGKKISGLNLDVSNEGTEIKFLPDLVNKNLIMTYKADSDVVSKAYTDNVKETYGQITITYEDQHLYGTTTQDMIFYSTPISRSGGNLNIFDGDGNNPTNPSGSLKITAKDGNLISYIDYSNTTNIKLLYDNKIIFDFKSNPFLVRIKRPKNSLYSLNSYNGQSQTYAWTHTIAADDTQGTPIYYVGYTYFTYKNSLNQYGYPYVGHFYPNPIAPSLDLNYAICDYYAYPEIIADVNNNLFYRHYQRTIRQINSGRLLTCKLFLKDINILDFKNTYFIMGKYWYLNKIKSYDANSGELVECEFINVI